MSYMGWIISINGDSKAPTAYNYIKILLCWDSLIFLSLSFTVPYISDCVHVYCFPGNASYTQSGSSPLNKCHIETPSELRSEACFRGGSKSR